MLLSSRSPFFHSAFNGSFKEAASSLLSMADDAPQVFDLVVRWMYTGTIDPMTVDDHGNGNGDGNSTGDCALTTTVAPFIYLQLFVLADKSQMPQLASSALHTIRAGILDANYRMGVGGSVIRDGKGAGNSMSANGGQAWSEVLGFWMFKCP